MRFNKNPLQSYIQDLHVTTEQVNLTITVYMILQAVSPAFWGTLSDTYGRRIVLLATVFVYCGACIGLALTPNYASLLVFRMLQAFGSSSVIAIGAGIVGDLAERKKYLSTNLYKLNNVAPYIFFKRERQLNTNAIYRAFFFFF